MAFRSERFGINAEMRGARSVITNLNAIAKALDATRLAATKTFQIDRQIRMLGVQAGNTAQEISRLSMTTAGLAQATGVSIDKTTELIAAYQATGKTIGEFTGKAGKVVDQFNAMSSSGAENYRMMTELVGRFNISAKAAVEMERSIGHLAGPKAFGQLLDKTVEFQQRFKMPGMIGALPRVVGFAEKSLTEFGHVVASNSQEIIYNTLKVGATYAKTFGVDAVEGINKAMANQRRFLQQTRNDLNVFLGLAEDFDPLTKALQETGLGIEQVQDLTKLGQKDPIEYARVIRSMFDQLGGDNNLYAQRFLENIRKNSSEMVQKLLSNEHALEDAIHQRNEAAKDTAAVKNFTEMADSVRNIGSELLNTISRLALLGRTVIGLTFVEDFAEPMGGAVDILKRFNNWLRQTALEVKNSKWFEEWKPRIQLLAKGLLALGAAAGVVASTFAAAILPFQTMVSVIKLIPLIGSGAVLTMDKLGGAIISFGKGIIGPVGIIAGIGSALNDFGKALSDPTISERPFELIVRGLRAVAVGVVETFDNLLFGLPTTIVKWFYPEMQGTLGDTVKRLFTDLQLWLERGATQVGGGWWDGFKRTLTKKVNEFYDYLLNNQERFSALARDWGENIGRSIGTLAKWAWDAIKPLFQAETWRNGFDRIVRYIEGDAKTKMGDSFQGILTVMLGHGRTFIVSMTDEVLRPWGMGWIEVKQQFDILWQYMQRGFAWFQNIGLPTMEQKWIGFKISLVKAFFAIKDAAQFMSDAASSILTSMGSHIEKAWHDTKAYYLELKVMGKEAILWAAKRSPQYIAAQTKYLIASTFGSEESATAAAQELQRMDQGWAANLGLTDDRAELRIAQADAEAARLRAAGADTDIARFERQWRERSAASQGAVNDQFKEDFARQNDLTSWLTGSGAIPSPAEAAYEQVRAQTEDRIRQIEARDAPRIEARNREWRRDLAQRTQDATEVHRVRPELISALDSLVNRIDSQLTTASPGLRPGLERILTSVQNARNGVRSADTAQEAVRRFNVFMNWLDENYKGLRQGLGGPDINLNTREYTAPPPVELEAAPTPGNASNSVGGDAAAWRVGAGLGLDKGSGLGLSANYALSDGGVAADSDLIGVGLAAKGMELRITGQFTMDADDNWSTQVDRRLRIMTQITPGF